MAAMQEPNFVARLRTAAMQDPKKAGMLAVLLAVLLGLWGKTLLSGGHSTPASASGATLVPSAQPATGDSPDKHKSQDSSDLLHDWLSEPLPESVSRNMFQVNIDYYPMETNHVAQDSRTINDPTFWDKLAKSIDAQADQQHKRENLIQNLRQQAGQLQVTMAVMGSHPKATINGEMVGEGEVVAGFRVLKIEARSVIVEREGIRLEIPMK